MILVVVKSIHIIAISLWAAGLVALPVFYRLRGGLDGDALHKLQALTRTLYVGFVSPAAFVAIGSGTVLIFLRETFAPWFTVKLFLVAIMAGIHLFSGMLILRLFEPGRSYPAWRFIAVTSLTLLVVCGIIAMVLVRPAIDESGAIAAFFEPGALPRIAADVIAWVKP